MHVPVVVRIAKPEAVHYNFSGNDNFCNILQIYFKEIGKSENRHAYKIYIYSESD